MNSRIFCIVALGLSAGCSGKDKDAASNDESGKAADGGGTTATTETAGARGGGSISGMVNFTGTAPKNPTIDMSEEAACKAKYPSPPMDPKVAVTGGHLANVFVYVKGGIPAGARYAAPTTAAVIDQDGCMYTPRVFGVMVGQSIDIKNSDPTLHNIKAVPTANRGFNISQPTKGMTTTRTFNTEEVMVPLQCNVHSWMNAYVGVLSHPFFATSGGDGGYMITGLPAGTYELVAWHETLGTRTMTVTVGADEKKTADFAFAPKA